MRCAEYIYSTDYIEDQAACISTKQRSSPAVEQKKSNTIMRTSTLVKQEFVTKGTDKVNSM